MRLILTFLLFSFSLFSEQLPFLIQDCVNAITGECTLSREDLRIEAPESLIIKRMYVDGQWTFLPHGLLKLSVHVNKKGRIDYGSVQVREPCGTLMTYTQSGQEYAIDWAASKGFLAHSESGLVNQRLVRTDLNVFTIFAFDGTRRQYTWTKTDKTAAYYVLTSEQLPNGIVRYYDYDEFHRLAGIKIIDASGTRTFAWCRLEYSASPSRGNDCTLTASDGRSLKYHYIKERKDHFLLSSISGAISEQLFYDTPNEHFPPLLSHWESNNRTCPHIQYYAPGLNQLGEIQIKLSEKDARVGRVSMLTTDQGIMYRFFYFDDHTEVTDSERNNTMVYFGKRGFPSKIDYCDEFKKSARTVALNWSDSGQLLEKRVYDASGKELQNEMRSYDTEGNLLDIRINGTSFARTTFGPRHLPVEIQDAEGLIVQLEYLPDTSLPTASYTLVDGKIIRRTFFEYDDSHSLVKMINDDGSAREQQDLSDVGVRTIHTMVLGANSLPVSIEMRAWDGHQELLLKKQQLVRSQSGEVVEIRTFSPTDVLLKTEKFPLANPPILDRLGRVKEENGVQFFYDNRNQCIAQVYDDKKTSFQYDILGHLTASVVDGLKTTYKYDALGREILSVDPLGQVTKRQYNELGLLAQVTYHDGKEERFSYSSGGHLTASVDVRGLQTIYTHNALGQVLTAKSYSPEGVLLRQEVYNYQNDRLISFTDGAGATTYYSYDFAGRRVAEEVTTAIGVERTLYEYDALDRLIAVTRGEICEKIQYDSRDLPIERHLETKTGELLSKTTPVYDEAGNFVKEVSWLNDGPVKTEEKVPDTNKKFDILGRCVEEKEGDVLILSSYDPRGELKSQTIHRPQGDEQIEIEGNVKTTRLADGVTITELHNALGQLVEIKSSDDSMHQRLFYNGRGDLIQADDLISRTVLLRSYDAKGRLVSETLPSGLKLRFEYDLSGRKKRLFLPDNSSIVYRYAQGRLKEVVRLQADEKLLYKHSFFDYDLSGFPKRQRMIEGLGELIYTINNTGRISHVATPYGEFAEPPRPLKAEKRDLTKRARHFHEETATSKIDLSYDIFGRCIAKREIELVSGTWQLKNSHSFIYDDQIEIGSIDEKGAIKQLKMRAPISANAGDSSLVFELEGRPYVPIFDPAGNVRELISVSRRYPIEHYSYDEKGRCEMRNEWNELIPESRIGNPWRFQGMR